VEAMHFGCPVVCFPIPRQYRKRGGDAAFYFEPDLTVEFSRQTLLSGTEDKLRLGAAKASAAASCRQAGRASRGTISAERSPRRSRRTVAESATES